MADEVQVGGVAAWLRGSVAQMAGKSVAVDGMHRDVTSYGLSLTFRTYPTHWVSQK